MCENRDLNVKGEYKFYVHQRSRQHNVITKTTQLFLGCIHTSLFWFD